MGMILSGTLTGERSLRGHQDLARIDIGSLRNTGGLSPDHAALGRFIPWHKASLTGDFVAELTRTVLKETGTGITTVAGDSTVVQAAVLCYHTIQLERRRQRLGRHGRRSRQSRKTPR